MDDTLDVETLVSGHAVVSVSGTRQDLRAQREYYLDLGDAVAQANGDVDAARRILEPKYGGRRRFDQMIAENIQGYLEWTTRQP